MGWWCTRIASTAAHHSGKLLPGCAGCWLGLTGAPVQAARALVKWLWQHAYGLARVHSSGFQLVTSHEPRRIMIFETIECLCPGIFLDTSCKGWPLSKEW